MHFIQIIIKKTLFLDVFIQKFEIHPNFLVCWIISFIIFQVRHDVEVLRDEFVNIKFNNCASATKERHSTKPKSN